MNKLEENLDEILRQKEEYLVPGNLKKDVTILGVTGALEATGIDTSDATATADDIMIGATAYAKGEKITGTVEYYADGYGITCNPNQLEFYDEENYFAPLHQSNKKFMIGLQGQIRMPVEYSWFRDNIGLTPDKLKKGETMLGITGTLESGGNDKLVTYICDQSELANVETGNGQFVYLDKYGVSPINKGISDLSNTALPSVIELTSEQLELLKNNSNNPANNSTTTYGGNVYREGNIAPGDPWWYPVTNDCDMVITIEKDNDDTVIIKEEYITDTDTYNATRTFPLNTSDSVYLGFTLEFANFTMTKAIDNTTGANLEFVKDTSIGNVTVNDNLQTIIGGSWGETYSNMYEIPNGCNISISGHLTRTGDSNWHTLVYELTRLPNHSEIPSNEGLNISYFTERLDWYGWASYMSLSSTFLTCNTLDDHINVYISNDVIRLAIFYPSVNIIEYQLVKIQNGKYYYLLDKSNIEKCQKYWEDCKDLYNNVQFDSFSKSEIWLPLLQGVFKSEKSLKWIYDSENKTWSADDIIIPITPDANGAIINIISPSGMMTQEEYDEALTTANDILGPEPPLYIIEEDGTIVNISPKLQEEHISTKGILSANYLNIRYYPLEGSTHVTGNFTVTEDRPEGVFEIRLSDKEGNITQLGAYISERKAGQSAGIDASIGGDYASTTYDYEIYDI